MKNIGSLVIYLSVYGISVFFSFIYQKFKYQEKDKRLMKLTFMVLIILPVVIMQGGRYLVGTDYRSYAILYGRIANGNEYTWDIFATEPLYLLEIRILSRIFGNYICFFVAHAAIEGVLIFFLFDSFKNTINLPLAYLAYYSIVQPYFMNGERQAVAMCIVWFSMQYLIKNNFKKYAACIIAAGCMHNSAFIFIALYAVNFLKRLKARKVWEVFAVTLAFIIFINPKAVIMRAVTLLFSRYIKFLPGSFQGISMAWVLPVVFVVPCLFLIKSSVIKNRNYHLAWMYMYAANIIFVLMSGYTKHGFRLAMYCNISAIILIPLTYASLQKENNKRIFLGGYIFVFLVYYIILYYVVGCAEVYPYRSIWTEEVIKWEAMQ